MKKTTRLILFAALALILAGCTNTVFQNTDSDTGQTTAVLNTDISSSNTTVAPVTSDSDMLHTTTADPTSEPNGTDATTDRTDTITQITTVTTTARFPAESDDYGNSGDPHPLNFTYVFTVEGIGLRIEGGNYQTLRCPMSKETASYLAEHYIIQDCNFDGYYDLLLPVQIIGDNTAYALYLWDQSTLRFHETAVELINPRFSAEDATVHSRVKGSEWIETYEVYQWVDQDVQRMAQHIVNTQTRTVTSFLYSDGKITQRDAKTYDDDAKLQAFLNGL